MRIDSWERVVTGAKCRCSMCDITEYACLLQGACFPSITQVSLAEHISCRRRNGEFNSPSWRQMVLMILKSGR